MLCIEKTDEKKQLKLENILIVEVLPWSQIDASYLFAIEKLIVVFVGNQKRPLLNEINVKIVTHKSGNRGGLNLTKLI
jgi:hypothetical protein